MKVAVIMAAFNAAPFIADALRSLLLQARAAVLDVIVVDDGSTDATPEIVESMAAGTPSIRLIRVDHGGPAEARNHGLAALRADTDLVTFLDADDLSPPERLARDLGHFEADPELDMVYATTQLFDTPDASTLRPDPRGSILTIRGVQLGAGLYRHGLIERVGSFDPEFVQSEDTDYLLRIFELSPRYRIVDDISLYYRRHATNITRDRKTVSREFLRALHKSASRRRSRPDFTMPRGIFDARQVAEVAQWQP